MGHCQRKVAAKSFRFLLQLVFLFTVAQMMMMALPAGAAIVLDGAADNILTNTIFDADVDIQLKNLEVAADVEVLFNVQKMLRLVKTTTEKLTISVQHVKFQKNAALIIQFDGGLAYTIDGAEPADPTAGYKRPALLTIDVSYCTFTESIALYKGFHLRAYPTISVYFRGNTMTNPTGAGKLEGKSVLSGCPEVDQSNQGYSYNFVVTDLALQHPHNTFHFIDNKISCAGQKFGYSTFFAGNVFLEYGATLEIRNTEFNVDATQKAVGVHFRDKATPPAQGFVQHGANLLILRNTFSITVLDTCVTCAEAIGIYIFEFRFTVTNSSNMVVFANKFNTISHKNGKGLGIWLLYRSTLHVGNNALLDVRRNVQRSRGQTNVAMMQLDSNDPTAMQITKGAAVSFTLNDVRSASSGTWTGMLMAFWSGKADMLTVDELSSFVSNGNNATVPAFGANYFASGLADTDPVANTRARCDRVAVPPASLDTSLLGATADYDNAIITVTTTNCKSCEAAFDCPLNRNYNSVAYPRGGVRDPITGRAMCVCECPTGSVCLPDEWFSNPQTATTAPPTTVPPTTLAPQTTAAAATPTDTPTPDPVTTTAAPVVTTDAPPPPTTAAPPLPTTLPPTPEPTPAPPVPTPPPPTKTTTASRFSPTETFTLRPTDSLEVTTTASLSVTATASDPTRSVSGETLTLSTTPPLSTTPSILVSLTISATLSITASAMSRTVSKSDSLADTVVMTALGGGRILQVDLNVAVGDSPEGNGAKTTVGAAAAADGELSIRLSAAEARRSVTFVLSGTTVDTVLAAENPQAFITKHFRLNVDTSYDQGFGPRIPSLLAQHADLFRFNDSSTQLTLVLPEMEDYYAPHDEEVTVTMDKEATKTKHLGPLEAKFTIKAKEKAELPAAAVTAATTAVVIGSSAGALAAASGVSASQAAKTKALLELRECYFTYDEQLDWSSSPIPWAIGSEKTRYYTGAALGNTLLIFGLCSMHVLAAKSVEKVRASAAAKKQKAKQLATQQQHQQTLANHHGSAAPWLEASVPQPAFPQHIPEPPPFAGIGPYPPGLGGGGGAAPSPYYNYHPPPLMPLGIPLQGPADAYHHQQHLNQPPLLPPPLEEVQRKEEDLTSTAPDTQHPFLEALAIAKMPYLTLVPIMFIMQETITAGIVSVLHSEGIDAKVIGIATCSLWLLVWIVAAGHLAHRFDAVFITHEEEDEAWEAERRERVENEEEVLKKNSSKLMAVGGRYRDKAARREKKTLQKKKDGEKQKKMSLREKLEEIQYKTRRTKMGACLFWVFMGDGDWNNKNDELFYCGRFGSFFDAYRQGASRFILVDVVVIFAAGVIMAIRPDGGRCELVTYAIAGLFGLYFILLVLIRPYFAPFRMVFNILLAGLQFGSALSEAISSAGNGSTTAIGGICALSSMFLVLFGTVVDLILVLFDTCLFSNDKGKDELELEMKETSLNRAIDTKLGRDRHPPMAHELGLGFDDDEVLLGEDAFSPAKKKKEAALLPPTLSSLVPEPHRHRKPDSTLGYDDEEDPLPMVSSPPRRATYSNKNVPAAPVYVDRHGRSHRHTRQQRRHGEFVLENYVSKRHSHQSHHARGKGSKGRANDRRSFYERESDEEREQHNYRQQLLHTDHDSDDSSEDLRRGNNVHKYGSRSKKMSHHNRSNRGRRQKTHHDGSDSDSLEFGDCDLLDTPPLGSSEEEEVSYLAKNKTRWDVQLGLSKAFMDKRRETRRAADEQAMLDVL